MRLKITPDPKKWKEDSLKTKVIFYVGVNPKNDRVYIRGEYHVLRSIRPLKRILLQNFNNTNYGLIITENKLCPLPKHIKAFLYRISQNKKLIGKACRFGITELII